jgi:hypothetical protein
VHFNDQGRAVFVIGNSGTPPAADLFDEEHLRSWLQLLDTGPDIDDGGRFRPQDVIKIVNTLQPLGKRKVLALVQEYLRVTSGWHSGRVHPVLRVLFDVPDKMGRHPPVYPGCCVPEAPKDPNLLPRFPMIVVDGIPLVLVDGYVFGGDPEPADLQLPYYRDHCSLREKPLRPGPRPWRALKTFMESPKWFYGKDPASPESNDAKILIARQLLTLMKPSVKVTVDFRSLENQDGGKFDREWDALCKRFECSELEWNAVKNQYELK